MAWQHTINTVSRSTLQNAVAYKTRVAQTFSKQSTTGAVYPTASAAETAAKNAAQAAAKSAAQGYTLTRDEILTRMADYVYNYSGGETSVLSSSNNKIGNEFETGTSISVGTPTAQSSYDSSTGKYSGTGDCTSRRWIGSERTSFAQLLRFELNPSLFDNGSLTLTFSGNGTFSCYCAVGATSFVNDYTNYSNVIFNGTAGTITVALSSLKNAIRNQGETAVNFVIGFTNVKAEGNLVLESASLSFDYSYTAPTAPTYLSVSQSIQKPGASVQISWSGASAGINVPIQKYRVFYEVGKEPTEESSYKESISSPLSFDVTSDVARGAIFYFKVQSIGAVNGYNSPIGEATISFSVNRLPIVSISNFKDKVPSTGGTPSAQISGTDEDGQNLTFFYAVGSGEKTAISGTTWTGASITSQTTYKFWAFDGLEYSAPVEKTISVNVKPTFATETKISGAAYESELNVTSYSYVPIPTLTFAPSSGKTAEEISYEILYSDEIGSAPSENNVLTLNGATVSLGEALGPGDNGRQYKGRIRYYDGIEWSDWSVSSIYCLAPFPKIKKIYNGHDLKTIEGTTENNFYRNFSISYTRDTAFSGSQTAPGASLQWGKAESAKGVLISIGEAGTDSTPYINGIYDAKLPEEYAQQINFQMTAAWGTRTKSETATLVRCQNLSTGSEIKALQGAIIKPYSKTTLDAIILPFYAYGDFVNGNQTLNLGKTPLSAVIQIGESESYELPLISHEVSSDSNLISTWSLTNLAEKISNSASISATFFATFKTLFEESFTVSQSIILDFTELTQLTASPIAIRIADGTAALVQNSKLYEGEVLTFPYSITGPNIQIVRVNLQYRGKKATEQWDGKEWSTLSFADKDIVTKNGTVNDTISYTIKEQFEDRDCQFRFSVVGRDTALTNNVLVGDTYQLRRATAGQVQITYPSYGPSTTDSSQNSWKMTSQFSDYGGAGMSTYEDFNSGEVKLQLQYQEGNEIKNLLSTPLLLSCSTNDFASFPLEVIANFPEGKTSLFVRLAVLSASPYALIGTQQPISAAGATSLEKVFYSNWISIYNIVPLLRYGKNRLGINVVDFSENASVATHLLEIAKNNTKDTIAAIGEAVYLDNFIIDGGAW